MFQCQWYKDGHKVKEEEERLVIEQEGLTHRLIITNARVSDAGKYECVFEEVSTWCNLTVKGLCLVDKVKIFQVKAL